MKNERKKAAALTYDQLSEAVPRLTALGKGRVADQIIDKAKEHHIPIVEDPSLVELLSTLNINDVIPEELYEAVAEVFAFIYQLDQNYNRNQNK